MSAFQGLFAPYWNAEARGYVCLYVFLSACYVYTDGRFIMYKVHTLLPAVRIWFERLVCTL